MNARRSFSGKHIFRRLLVGVLSLCLLPTMLLSCKKEKREEEESSRPVAMDYSQIEDFSLYVSLPRYTGLEIPLESESDRKSQRVWEAVLGSAEVLRYPEEQVRYYEEQTKATYRYYGQKNGWSLEETMDKLGVSEESIRAEAREMVKGDLVYHYIVDDAGILLTEEEKATLFDRYARQYAESYGYEVSYVTEQLSHLVYDSMLYDKTMEYLILHNDFILPEGGTGS